MGSDMNLHIIKKYVCNLIRIEQTSCEMHAKQILGNKSKGDLTMKKYFYLMDNEKGGFVFASNIAEAHKAILTIKKRPAMILVKGV